MKNRIIYTITIIILSMSLGQIAQAQCFDCEANLKIRYPKRPFEFNELSKSAICIAGQKYEYNISLEKNKDYRLSFFASSVFNNNIDFKIINRTTGELVMDLPGNSIDINQVCALQEFFDPETNQLIHPYFDLSPIKNIDLKIIVYVKPELNYTASANPGLITINQATKGCVTIYIQSKSSEQDGF